MSPLAWCLLGAIPALMLLAIWFFKGELPDCVCGHGADFHDLKHRDRPCRCNTCPGYLPAIREDA